ncbi:MAG: hypothetical protein EOR72_20260 [Mesorhizobium sp.]|uniref:hypothetical protein n=1 Tax=Mesorhizobium sp. TaxID=1871066 RepID=UPI000FEAB3CA|nr:hypothetical protein [Mesorhizobium sp.]RWM12858.1 MAG: hypothetical protein EOR72_20260 [Mesorhizobium sp.]
MEFNPENLIQARPWRKAVFTTYALSLSFFESVVLDGLVRGRTEDTLILADADGVRAGLSEQGAQRAGRDYELEPVVVDGARHVFHPKISAFVDKDDSHLVVGSGNLTFSGWGGNFEVAEHLHPSFAADAFDDASMLFMLMSDSPKVAHGAAARCAALADDLAAAAAGNARTGALRLVHSLDGPIGDRLAGFAEELGGATRLSAVSPFWDSGTAITRLCSLIGVGEVHVHAHPGGTVRGHVGFNWPSAAGAEVIPVTVSDLSAGDGRLLHAKAFEIVCRRGRILVSGSVNATSAALFSGNVEAAVVRIQRDRLLGWTLEVATAPVPLPAINADSEDKEGRVGILRAEVVGEMIKGTVLTPTMSGQGALFQRTSEGDLLLGEVKLDATGGFSLSVPGFELAAIRGGRVVFRIECGEQAAEGFATLSTLAGLRRIAGKSAASLFAVMSGTETPEDVRTLMEWVHDNPGIFRPAFEGGWRSGQPAEGKPSLIDVEDLWKTKEEMPHKADGDGEGVQRSWMRFVDALMAAMRERRGPVALRMDSEDEDDPENRKQTTKEAEKSAKNSAKALETFERVFEALLPKGASHQAVLRVFDLTAYVCDRLLPDIPASRAHAWLRRLVDAFCANGLAPTRSETVLSAIMALCGSDPNAETLRATRARVRIVGGDPSAPWTDSEEALAFRFAMGDAGPLGPAWDRAGATRTWREQARAYCEALFEGGPQQGFDELLSSLPSEASTLREALETGGTDNVVLLSQWRASCTCHMQLPKMEQGKLRAYGVATAANCCQKVLVWPEERANG